jgi:hypothetical protein
MAYTDRYYATSEDDPFPNDPFRKYFGPSPTPTPKPKPTQLAMLGQPLGLLGATNAADRVSSLSSTPAVTKRSSVQNILPSGPIGVTGGTGTVATPMTHNEFALDVARRNKEAVTPVETPEAKPATQSATVGTQELTPYGLQVQRFGSAANRVALQDPALRPGTIAAATAGGQPLQTATQPGHAALDIVPTGVPLMSVKGIVNPFTGQTEYQPIGKPSPYQGPAQYQYQQAATDFYRKREEDRTGYGSAY